MPDLVVVVSQIAILVDIHEIPVYMVYLNGSIKLHPRDYTALITLQQPNC
jgi:hypothetical protein